jgi:putative transposase
MSGMKSHYSCSELAEMRLPGMSTTRQGWEERVKRENWPFVEVKSRGRGGLKREYQPPSNILNLIRQKTVDAMLQEVPVVHKVLPVQASQPSVPAIVKTAVDLKDWQRATAEARVAICAEVKRLAEVGGVERAVRTVIELADQGKLPEHLQQLVTVANARSGNGGKRTLSRTSIFRWLKGAEGGVAKLAPKPPAESGIPSWAPYFLGLFQQPQSPGVRYCLDRLPEVLPAGIPVPSYDVVHRFLKKLSNTDKQRGRMGNRELKSIRPFVRRDTRQMWPGDAYTADGHTFDAEIAHPAHGKAFRPEITSVLDIATRRVVGWSAGLAESTWAVLDALRHACTSSGIPAIFYVDNGSGYKNAAMASEATGFMARIGTTLTHSLPYNSQARGLEERSHQTIWVRGAKELPTYMGADMDREAKQKAFKITRADLKLVGSSRMLMGWQEFTQWCQKQVDDYNNKPHRSLPKFWDEAIGKRRHQTPNEAWAQALQEGWEPTPVEAHEADDLFRPYKEAKTHRAEVRLFNNLYFHPDLEHYHGETVRVGYDIHDGSRVWVRNMKGQLICVAEFEANKRSYFPQSFIDQAAERRAQGRLKRAQAKIDEIHEELNPPQLLEQQPTFTIPTADLRELDAVLRPAGAEVAQVLELPQVKVGRPMFGTDAQKYMWLMDNPGEISAQDEAWLNYYTMTAEWEDLFGDREVAAR